jgi:hypothetical protein
MTEPRCSIKALTGISLVRFGRHPRAGLIDSGLPRASAAARRAVDLGARMGLSTY